MAVVSLATFLSASSSVSAASSAPIVLAPFKDDLYAIQPFDGNLKRCKTNPKTKGYNERTLALPRDDRHIIYDFDEHRDVNGRDVPLPNGKWQNWAKPQYITPLDPRDERKFDLNVATERGTSVLETNEVGNPNGAKFVIIFIHGAAGIYANRDLGMKDETFSGNFNRLKNMVVKNGGVYYTPTIKNFDDGSGVTDTAALIEHAARVAPAARIVLSCASSGGSVCAGIATSESASKKLSGIIVLGSSWNEGFVRTPAFRNRVPVVFAQGTCDEKNEYSQLFKVFSAIVKRDNRYPTLFMGFADGVHGTPIRMMDWRMVLNWLFAIER